MAHFAELDVNNIVLRVLVVHNDVITDDSGHEQEQLGVDFLASLYGGGWWKQTSYNNSFRKNYAGNGYTYDKVRDAFIAPQPFDSWSLNEDTCRWDAPTPYPDDGKVYEWNEDATSWDEVDMGDR